MESSPASKIRYTAGVTSSAAARGPSRDRAWITGKTWSNPKVRFADNTGVTTWWPEWNADWGCLRLRVSAALLWGYNDAQRMGLTSGIQLGPYEIVSPLGAGGMGEVYRARDTRLDRTVAVKILPAHLSGCDIVASEFDPRQGPHGSRWRLRQPEVP